MTNAKEHWDNEYKSGSPHFTALASREPSSAAIRFLNYPKIACNNGVTGPILYPGQATLEVGCGMGRNTNWFAKFGWSTTGMDISSEAINDARKRARETGVNVNYVEGDITQRWPFENESFDLVFDLATLHLLTSNGARDYSHELYRCMKPGARLIVYTLERGTDECAAELLREHPGPEPNTYFLPEINHVERTFTLEELSQTFSPLSLEHSEMLKKETQYLGLRYLRHYWWAVFRKIV